MDNYNIVQITKENFIEEIFVMKNMKYRLIQISCTKIEDKFELNYSFGKDYDFINKRLIVSNNDPLLSISHIFYPAFLYENEIQDLFGLKFQFIEIDFEGKLYKLAEVTPFNSSEKV